MKELPTMDQPETSDSTEAKDNTTNPMPALPPHADRTSFSKTNKRATTSAIQTLYPWLLFATTGVAAAFCLAYISKPVILAIPSPSQLEEPSQIPTDSFRAATKSDAQKLLPSESALPGGVENSRSSASPPTPLASDFEETNIRIQHVLDAEFPSGDVSRIIVDVPVLYRSRNLRWTQSEAAKAKILHQRLAEYQERVRQLRSEGTDLLNEWNSLMTGSIPGVALRADSPSLPANQQDDLLSDSPHSSDTADTIKLKDSEK